MDSTENKATWERRDLQVRKVRWEDADDEVIQAAEEQMVSLG